MSKPSLAAKILAEKMGRPPLTYLTVELTLDNPTDAPRWFVIARQIPPDDGAGGGVDRVEVRGAGVATIGSFYGTGAFHAVRVGAKQKALVTNLAIDWWRASPTDSAPPPLGYTVADDVTLAGKPLSDWLGSEPLLATGTTVDGAGAITHEHRTADGAEAAVGLVGAVPLTADLAK